MAPQAIAPAPGPQRDAPVSSGHAEHDARRAAPGERHPPSRPGGLRRQPGGHRPGPTGYREATFTQVGGAGRAAGQGPAPARRRRRTTGSGTFAWNDQEHLEAYLAVPSMGAVLHTLNIRLFPEQLAYVVNHAEDQVVIVDASIAPAVRPGPRPSARRSSTSSWSARATPPGSGDTLSYDELVGAEEPGYDWPELDERQAASMCYTSGTTGNPKGVVYSHRSTWLHAFAGMIGNCVGASEQDRVLVDRAHVPRQRLGHALHGVLRRDRPHLPGALPPGRAAGRASSPSSARPCRSGCPPSGTTCCTTPRTTTSTCRRCGCSPPAGRRCRARSWRRTRSGSASP